MNNATVGNISMEFNQPGKDNTGGEEIINLSSRRQDNNNGNTIISLTTEGWSIDASEIDGFIKMLKKFKDQATGK